MRVLLAGFGVVGRSLAEIVIEHGDYLRKLNGLNIRFTAIVDSGGSVVDERGLNLNEVLNVKKNSGSVSFHPQFGRKNASVLELLDELEVDILIDATPTNLVDGEPSYTYIKKALTLGVNVVTVNKGPLAYALPALKELASYKGVLLRFSGTVGGGMPVIDFAKQCAKGDRVV
ncbi:MAG: homoserine dehydrogenase, partial [Nitrososphaerota archaeon]